jgi:transcriptional regulator with XRE-family HTH domain
MDAAITLHRLREERGLTQVQVAEALDVTQGNVSRLERSGDLYVSTLSRYVAALGGHLELTAVFPDQVVPHGVAGGRGTCSLREDVARAYPWSKKSASTRGMT